MDDLISRQAVIDILAKEMMEYNGASIITFTNLVLDRIEELPSVQPEPFINKPCVSEQACHEDKMKVLSKIRAEIETEKNAGCHTQYAGGLDFALSVIDRHMKESEET